MSPASPSLTLVRTVYTKDQMPDFDAPQIAMAGRSNVGKSSLINCLAGRKDLAKTSSTPGKTKSINFYLAQPGDFYLVDLPGYGYARASKSERDKWAALIEGYLRDNPHIRAVCVLIDCRLPPQKLDLELVAFMHSRSIPIIPVLTKADKCKQTERSAKQKEWTTLLGDIVPLLVSSKTGSGRDKLWRRLMDLAAESLETGATGDSGDADSGREPGLPD